MRRLIAYISMAVSMLIAIGVAATPVLTKLHGGREFREGREIVFNIKDEDGNLSTDANIADEVAKEFRTRLDNFGIEDYSVKIQGTDTITASFAVDDDQFNYVAKYLCFSGNNFAFSGKEETTVTTKENMIKASEARIEYYQDTIPVVVIPVTDDGKTEIEGLISKLTPEKKIKRDAVSDGGEETAAAERIFLWSNYEEGDSYDDAVKNPLMGDKILMSFETTNIWYVAEGKESEEPAKDAISFMCATATQPEGEDEQPQLDVSKLENDNIRAKYLLNLIQATDFSFGGHKYEISCPTRNVTASGVDYLANASYVSESAERLVSQGNIATNKIFYATIIAIFIVSLLLVVYYRLSALAIASTTLGTLFLTILAISNMTVLFNIPAIIGLTVLAIGTLFGEIVYVNRFKEEVYKGRSVKKANQEASKRSNLLTLDASVIMAFAGLMMYVVGGTALQPLGVVLFFGSIFALAMNLIVFKVLMYLMTNTTSLQTKYSAFNINGDKVQNVMSTEQKEPYVGPYENTNFTKSKKPVGIAFAALAAAAVAVIAVFGAVNKFNSPLNVEKARANTTIIYTELEQNTSISDETQFKDYALKIDSNDGEYDLSKAEVKVYTVTNTEFAEGGNVENKTYYFVAELQNTYTDDQLSEIETAIENKIAESISSDLIVSVEARTSKELIYTPDQGLVALATGLTIVGVALYAAFRFGPSRGIALLATATGSTAIAYGIMAATRIPTTAVTSLAMPIVAITTLLASLFVLAVDKVNTKENMEKYDYEQSKEITTKSIGKAAAPLFVFMLLVIYITVNFLGFSVNNTTYLYLSAIVGELVGLVALLVVMGPLANVISKLFHKINLPKFKGFERKEKKVHVRNSSEPEETIFIGIND